MVYDPRKHRRRSICLKGYDYTQPGVFFVTICTFNRVCLFGQITGGQMQSNAYGCIVEEEWLKAEAVRPNVVLDAYVVMPNHVHGLVGIVDPERRRAPVRQFGKPVSGSLPTIIGAFKSAATKRINALRGTPGVSSWQRGYYEHIVRHERALERIRRYIAENPQRWQHDICFPGAKR